MLLISTMFLSGALYSGWSDYNDTLFFTVKTMSNMKGNRIRQSCRILIHRGTLLLFGFRSRRLNMQ